MKKEIYIIILLLGFISCGHQPHKVAHITGETILIDSAFDALQDSNYLQALAPIKADLEAKLEVPIGYAPVALSKCTNLNALCSTGLAMRYWLWHDNCLQSPWMWLW